MVLDSGLTENLRPERTVQWLSRGASELLAVAGMQEVHVVSLSVQVVLENPP